MVPLQISAASDGRFREYIPDNPLIIYDESSAPSADDPPSITSAFSFDTL
jgi:hypothetical protein